METDFCSFFPTFCLIELLLWGGFKCLLHSALHFDSPNFVEGVVFAEEVVGVDVTTEMENVVVKETKLGVIAMFIQLAIAILE